MTIKLKTILENEWEDFKENSDSVELKRKAVHNNIRKILQCQTLWLGLQVYQCEDHPDQARVVPNTCKSRFCPSCGYKANLVWLNQLLGRALPCDHQHLVFTLPSELRPLASFNRRVIFNLMSRTLWKTINQFLKKHEALNYLPGAVSILHTFGKGLKWHIHFHVLITAGGLKDGKWIKNGYLNEAYLKKAWKAKMLAGIRKLYRQGKLAKALGKHPGQSFEKLLSDIYENNWYVWIDQVKGDGKFAFIYLGRYAKRACISQKGIIEYRPGKLVRWKERSSKVPAPDICAYRATPEEFLDLLIHHIPDFYEHQVYYYGLYSSRQKNTHYTEAAKLLKKPFDFSEMLSRLNWSKVMQMTHDFKPLACPICQKTMKLTGILFFNQRIPAEKEFILNHEIKKYQLVEKVPDTS